MTTTAAPTPWGTAPQEVRVHVRAVREWALGRGRAVCPDALTTVLFAARRPLDAPTVWTVDDVVRLVWIDAHAWCEHVELRPPPGVAEAFWLYLSWLDGHGRLAPGSDPLAALHAALAAHTGLGPNGLPVSRRRRSRPARPGATGRSGRPGQLGGGCGNVRTDPESRAEVLPWRT
jgi:hypothetical protein